MLAISFGAGLGILIPKTRRSLKRGVGHLATLVVSAAGSAAAVVVSMMLFGALDQPWAKHGVPQMGLRLLQRRARELPGR